MMRAVGRRSVLLFLSAVALAVGQVSVEATRPVSAVPLSETESAVQFRYEDPLRVLRSDDAGMEFELVVDRFETAADGFVGAPGLDRVRAPGEPDLVGREVLVGIPQQGGVRLSVETSGTERFDDTSIRPAPGFSPEPVARSDAFGEDRFWPGPVAELLDIGTMRGVRVARVRVNPVQYNPVARAVLAHRRVKVTLSFERSPQERGGFDRFGDVLAPALLNGERARHWKTDAGTDSDSINFFSRYGDWCKVVTETTGVYRVTPDDLENAGIPVSGVDPRTLRLFSVGRYDGVADFPDTMVEVPVFVSGEDDGSFDGSDFLAFYAESPSTWADDTTDTLEAEWRTNYYTLYRSSWLTWGDGPGRRMATVSGAGASSPQGTAPHRVRAETDRLCPARSGLLWLEERYSKQAGLPSLSSEHPLTLPNRDSIYELKMRFYASSGVNNLRVYLNGVELDSFAFSGASSTPPPADVTLSDIPAAAQAAGDTDTLTFELLGDNEMEVYLDYIEARYVERLEVSGSEPFISFTPGPGTSASYAVAGASGDVLVLDVSDRLNPKRVVDTEVSGSERRFRYDAGERAALACALTGQLREPVSVERRTPGGLRGAAESVDYYIICPDEFITAARIYARFRDGAVAGIPDANVAAVPLSDIYDDYGFGMEEPGAVKRFLAAKQPVYALFAGDATYDYRNNLDLETAPPVPTYSVGFDIDPEVYGSAAKAFDAWFADFDGEGSTPDIVLGRVTCRSSSELRRFMDKVRTYETQPPGFWSKRFLLLADDEWLGQPDLRKRDPIGFAHIGGCENIMLYTEGLLDPVKVYLTEYPFTGVNDKAAAREELLERLRQGALFWCFYGHGAGFQLCHERALNIDGVGDVETGTRNPLAFFGSCGVGRFEDTRYQAIAEELVRMGSGCIATSGATKATTPGGNELVARTLFSNLIQRPDEPIGASYYPAWLKNTTYHLFGDPATMLRVPASGVEPVLTPDTLRPGGVNELTDSVPAGEGWFGVDVHEEDWFRSYYSDAGATTYLLPGYRLHAGLGSFQGGQARTSFTVPRLDYPDTTVVPNGSYVRVPGSGWASVLAWQDHVAWSSRLNGLSLGDTVSSSDIEPPAIVLSADDIELNETDTIRVPREFTLRGVCTDESGVLLAPVPDYGLSFYLGVGVADRRPLHGRFSYDKNSTTTGRFDYPLEVGQGVELDSLTITLSDNLRNRRVSTFRFRTELNEALRVDSCLVYPNPTAGWPGETKFTFELSRAAFVGVKVYTISGRLVRRLPERPCGFGYNEITWDGLDERGNSPANGVYLYKLDARSSEAGAGAQSYSATVRDRLVIHR